MTPTHSNLIIARTEHDFLGERNIPTSVYWGIHTARALENFSVSGIRISQHRELVAALGSVKQAAVRANLKLGVLEEEVAQAIDDACGDVCDGLLDDQFVVDVLQGGAGTSTNMNANEVIANRALERLGLQAGDYDVVNPNDHVNRSQSTNDVYPTAVKIALLMTLDKLAASLGRLVSALDEKAQEFADLVKVGRTQLQDAVPMTVGQEFLSWSLTLAEEQDRILDARRLLLEVNLGATAIGTGITTKPGYAALAVTELAELTGLPLVGAKNLIEATSDTGSFVQLSGMLKRSAVKVSKICNDLRLLSSGPRAGFGELRLPDRQAGSSIMPGKVNPVIPELVNQVAFTIVGNDVTVAMAAEAGQLQLNAFEPIIAHTLLQGICWLSNALDSLTEHCICGIGVNREHIAVTSARNIGLATALAPVIGYTAAARIARISLASGQGIAEIARSEGLLAEELLTASLRPESMTSVAEVERQD